MSDQLPAPPRSRILEKKRRDEQIRRKARRLATLGPAHLADPKYRPAVESLARLSLLLERSYEALKGQPLVNPETGELRPSIDVVRRLIATQADLLKNVGLMPTSALPESHTDSTLDAVFTRIEKVRQQREQKGKDESDPGKDAGDGEE